MPPVFSSFFRTPSSKPGTIPSRVSYLDGAHLLIEDKKVLNFCSDDYLGLSQHAELKKSSMKALLQYGSASNEFCLGNGKLQCQEQLEQKLCELFDVSHVLLFSSLLDAHVTAFSLFSEANGQLFYDSICQEGMRASFSSHFLEKYAFEHNNIKHLEELLEKEKKSSLKVIVTESLFGQTGDICPLTQVAELAERYNALLFVDDSYALGVMGAQGLGSCAQNSKVDLFSGVFSKACGTSGAYLCCPQWFYEPALEKRLALGICEPSFATLGAIDAATDLIPQLEGERQQLHQRAHWLRTQFQKSGLPLIFSSQSHILSLAYPLEKAEQLWLSLLEANILTSIIATPHGAILRCILNVQHTPEHLSDLAVRLQQCQNDLVLCHA